MGYHCRLYQHVHLDHGEVSVFESVVSLAALERTHRHQHDQGVFRNCDPHELEHAPIRTLWASELNDLLAGRVLAYPAEVSLPGGGS